MPRCARLVVCRLVVMGVSTAVPAATLILLTLGILDSTCMRLMMLWCVSGLLFAMCIPCMLSAVVVVMTLASLLNASRLWRVCVGMLVVGT